MLLKMWLQWRFCLIKIPFLTTFGILELLDTLIFSFPHQLQLFRRILFLLWSSRNVLWTTEPHLNRWWLFYVIDFFPCQNNQDMWELSFLYHSFNCHWENWLKSWHLLECVSLKSFFLHLGVSAALQRLILIPSNQTFDFLPLWCRYFTSHFAFNYAAESSHMCWPKYWTH